MKSKDVQNYTKTSFFLEGITHLSTCMTIGHSYVFDATFLANYLDSNSLEHLFIELEPYH